MTAPIYQDPRDYLLLELEKRQSRNGSYSLRAFARDLAIAPSTLSEVIKGRYGLSERKAGQVAQALGLSENESEHFVDLFLKRFGQKRVVRRTASSRIFKRRAQSYHSLAVDSFRAIGDWYHLVILEWMAVRGGSISVKSVRSLARELDMKTSEVDEALCRLARLGQVELQNDQWVLLESHTTVGGTIPSDAIRRFHRQILEKALHSLENDDISKRDFSSTVFSFPKDKMDEARKALKDFRREFGERFSSGETDSVYCLAVHLFPLAQNVKETDHEG